MFSYTSDVPVLIRDVRKLFYSLYDEYAEFYGPSININTEQDTPSTQAPTSQIGKGYQMLFQKTKKSWGSSSSLTQNYITTFVEFVNTPDFDMLQW